MVWVQRMCLSPQMHPIIDYICGILFSFSVYILKAVGHCHTSQHFLVLISPQCWLFIWLLSEFNISLTFNLFPSLKSSFIKAVEQTCTIAHLSDWFVIHWHLVDVLKNCILNSFSVLYRCVSPHQHNVQPQRFSRLFCILRCLVLFLGFTS